MGYNNYGNNEYQQAGYKGLERYDITLRIIENIDLMGDLFTSLRFRGITQESQQIYEAFINSFFKVFHITASMMKEEDLELIANIEAAFQSDIKLSVEVAGYFLNLFEDYLHSMKNCGIYDPMVIKQIVNPLSAWQESI